MLNRRKKSIKVRGMHTHGYGSKKKHRGSGHQGGVGMAGTGKRADQKKPSVWKDKKYFGRHGFTTQSKTVKTINLFYIEDHFESLLKDGTIKKEADCFLVNLKDLNADKLLGSGEATRKYKIVAHSASESAMAKVQEAKGTVEVAAKKEKKVAAKEVAVKKK
jgi:large subunit ribosomal protein L15